jgi:pentatricopeptide repeat protein
MKACTGLVWMVGLLGVPNMSNFSLPTPAQATVANWQDLHKQAEQAEREDRYSAAEILYRQIFSGSQPSSMNDYMYYYLQIRWGKILQVQGKFSEAIAIFRQVINPPTERLHQREPADSYLLREAELALQGAIDHQQDAAARVTKGLQSIRQYPEYSGGYEELARGLAAQGRLANGLEFLATHVGALSPETCLKLARAASSYGVEGNISGSGYRTRRSILPDAIALFRQVVDRYPQYQVARNEWLEILDREGAAADSIAAYRSEILLQPQNEVLYWLLAAKLARNQQFDEAIALYERMVKQGWATPRLYIALGRALEENKQADRALQVYLQGVAAFPDNGPSDRRCHVLEPSVYESFVGLLASQNRLGSVLTILEASIPNPSFTLYENLYLALRTRDHQESAMIVYRRIQERYSNASIRQSGKC